MAWIPKIEIIAGKLAGLTPAGSLDSVPDYLGNNFGTQGDGSGGTAQYDQMPWEDPTSWPGAYGSDMSSVVAEARQASLNNVLFAEIPVKNPEGATFYKHTINFYGSLTCTHFQDQDFEGDALQFILGRITRKVYADPNTPFVETELFHITLASAPTYNILIQGDKDQFPYAQLSKSRMAFGFYTYEDTEYFGAFIYCNGTLYNYDTDSTAGSLSGLSVDYLSEQFGVDFDDALEETDDPNEEPEPDGPGPGPGGGGGGGEGGHHLPQDPIDVPPLPEIGAASVSWLTVYKMTTNDINDFGEELMNPSVIDVLKSFFNDPLDSIVGIILIPFNAPTTRHGTPEVPGLVPYTWSRSFDVVTKEFVELDCGTLYIEPYYDSAFDMNPYTRYYVWLPFIGYREINADEIAGNTIGIKYHIDVLTGDCTAFIYRGAGADNFYGPSIPQVIEQFSGNCGVRVPIGRVSYDAAVNAAFTLLSQGVGMAVGYAASAAGLANSSEVSDSQIANQVSAATMSAVNGAKTAIQRSGAVGGAAAYMGIVKPYIIKEVPRQSLPSNYRMLEGYPANKGGTLSQYAGTGLQVVEVIELDNLTAFESEISEIKTLLKGGVLV